MMKSITVTGSNSAKPKLAVTVKLILLHGYNVVGVVLMPDDDDVPLGGFVL